MPLWREAEPEVFRGAVLAAAERLDVLPLAVEKDYWVCQTLRSVVTAHPNEVVFKGGTSLEKLGIIRRFSEDLDLLVVGDYASVNAQKNALKRLLTSAAVPTGSKPDDVKSGGNAGSFYRSGYLNPPLEHRGGRTAIADPAAILVEFGQSGGPNPHDNYPVTSLLSRELAATDFDTSEWADLSSVDVAILHPGRTLLEKLLRVNNFASDPEATNGPHGWPRIGRQMYDIHALLLDPTVRELLLDRALVAEILTSAQQVSAGFSKPDLPVPTGGFAESPAFTRGSEFTERLRVEHDAAMRDLYYGTDTPPSFDDVLDQVHADATLLSV